MLFIITELDRREVAAAHLMHYRHTSTRNGVWKKLKSEKKTKALVRRRLCRFISDNCTVIN